MGRRGISQRARDVFQRQSGQIPDNNQIPGQKEGVGMGERLKS